MLFSESVRVIARWTLTQYVANCAASGDRKVLDSKLRAWFALVEHASWRTSAELKDDVSSASIISSERVVFNIKGNDYRLIVAIDYAYQILLIKWLGTHAEYDRIDALTIDYEKERYANSTYTK